MRRVLWVLPLFLVAAVPAAAQATGDQQARETDAESNGMIEHRVQPGETLWSLSSSYLGDPFEWRRILEANPGVITNPESIEPGTLLKIPARAGGAAAPTRTVMADPYTAPSGAARSGAAGNDAENAAVQGFQVTTVPRRFGTPVRAMAGPPPSDRTIFYTAETARTARPDAPRQAISAASGERMYDAAVVLTAVPRDVFYTGGWLVPEEGYPDAVGKIVQFAAADRGRIFDRTTAYPFDRLRVELGDGPVPAIGDQFMTFRMGREVENVGRVVEPTGVVTVTRIEDGSVVAVLDEEYGRVDVGDGVVAVPHYPIQAGEFPRPTQRSISGHILMFKSDHLVQSLGSVAYVDLGKGSGVAVGDEFEVLTQADGVSQPEVIGKVQIIGVQEDHSAVRIIDLTAPLFEDGLEVRLVAKMP